MLQAITREVSPRIEQCELTHAARQTLDVAVAQREHRDYCTLLEELGCRVTRLAQERDLPDSVFVEDTAVVVEEFAVITRPGAISRRQETRTIAQALAPYRELVTIEAPGTVDGGDVLRCGRRVWIGLSTRTNADGIAQLTRHLNRAGYDVQAVKTSRCLHLKSAATCIAPDTILANTNWVDATVFTPCRVVETAREEPTAGNALEVGGTVVLESSHARTRERVERAGFTCVTTVASELAKAEAGLTCCSLIFEA